LAKLQLIIPWSNLSSKPAIIRIEQVFLTAGPMHQDHVRSPSCILAIYLCYGGGGVHGVIEQRQECTTLMLALQYDQQEEERKEQETKQKRLALRELFNVKDQKGQRSS
jgi:hypothetical protein